MSETLGWGIIGCGDVVERKSGPSIEQAGRSRMVAVMRRDREQARAFAERHGVPVWTGEAQEILSHPDVDIVYVATPPSSHEEYVLAAARAGKPVLVEKPMGLNAGQARAMIAACDEAGVELFVAYYRRFQPHVRKMKALIDEGRIGRPVYAFIDLAMPSPKDGGWRVVPEISGGGHFVDVGAHRLDIVAFLFGDVAEASGVVAIFDSDCRVEQVVSGCIKFKSGAQCIARADYHSGRKVDRFEIVGTGGSMVMDSVDSYALTLSTPEGEEKFTFEPYPAPHLGLIRHVQNVLLDGSANESSGRDGLTTELVLDSMVRKHIGRV